MAWLHGPAHAARNQEELGRIEELRSGFAGMDRRARALFSPDGPNWADEPGLRNAVADGLLHGGMIEALARAVAGEQAEVAEIREGEDALTARVTVALVAGSLLLVPLALLAGHLLARSVSRPVAALAAAAAAVERGDLGHRVGWGSRDEVGLLARRFDAMVGELENRRARWQGLQAELERQVALRTAELADANGRLRELDRLRVQLLADIGHELRTPVTVLRGEAEVTLRHGPGAPEAVYLETLRRIAAGAADLGRLVDDLLFLARTEADQVGFHRRRAGLSPILAEAVREGETLARGKGIAVRAAAPRCGRDVEADPQRLKQALLTVLDNAVKYSPPGRAITVECRCGVDMAEIVVRDEGDGIPAEDLPHVFDRFYRGRGAERGGAEGSGLGLPIARSIVEKHGGAVEVESGPERGTTVRIHLPLLPAARPGAAPPRRRGA
jgi:signal transduction histidine kinase